MIDEALTASRLVTAELSPPILHDGGLPAGLKWLARRMADRHGLQVELSTERDLPPLGEDVRLLLFESVRELLFNSVKHAHVASVKVDLQRTAGSAIRITVRDTGPGFDPGMLKKAGETGGGYGLFSIRERLELLGGRMEIDSAPGQGSCITLTAPAGQAAFEAPASVPALQPRSQVEQLVSVGASGEGAPIRVLVADDHLVVREGLRLLLSQDPGIQVAGEAVDGRQAVEATRAVHKTYPDIRIIGLSMYQEADRAQAMRDAGAVDYLSKSDPPRDLLAAIRRACQPPAKTTGSPGSADHRRSGADRSPDTSPGEA
jgi:CheY-like chemotaxis protein